MASGERVIRSACRSCQGVCQGLVHIDDNGRIVQITGDKESPTSQGFICSKGEVVPIFRQFGGRFKVGLCHGYAARARSRSLV